MEVRHHVVGIVEGTVDAGVGQHDARHAAHGEEKDEAQRPQHRHAELERAAPHGGDPGEDLHARRHGDHHGGEHEVGLRIHPDAGYVHVVCPHDEPDKTDGDHGVDHPKVAKYWLPREGRHDLAYHAEA